MIKKFHLTINDLQPPYPVTVKDAAGNRVDLTGATIVCTMKLEGESTPKINRIGGAAIDIKNQTTNKGEFDYLWQSGDTDTAPSIDPSTDEPIPYYIEFEIDPAAGGKFTKPDRGQGRAQVLIWDSLDSV